MAIHLSLVRKQADRATVEAISRLLADAEAGNITGIAYVVVKPGGDYSGDVAGRLSTLPIYTLGLLKALEKTVYSLIP